MAKCEQGSEIYTDCINALQSVKEIGRLTLDHARDVGNTSQPAVGRGRELGGRQGQGGRQSSQHHTSSRPPTSSRRPTPLHDHTMEEASQTTDEMSLDTAYDIGSMAHDYASPSHTFAHAHPSRSPSMRSCGTYPPTSPSTFRLRTTRTSPPLTTGTAPAVVHGTDDMRFMPTLGRPTLSTVPPEGVHTEFIQTQIPTPPPTRAFTH